MILICVLSLVVQCLDLIESSRIMASQLCEDVDLHIMMHRAYGKGFIKTCKVSPDAYIQLALQLAYYRVSGGVLWRGVVTKTCRATVDCSVVLSSRPDAFSHLAYHLVTVDYVQRGVVTKICRVSSDAMKHLAYCGVNVCSEVVMSSKPRMSQW